MSDPGLLVKKRRLDEAGDEVSQWQYRLQADHAAHFVRDTMFLDLKEPQTGSYQLIGPQASSTTGTVCSCDVASCI
jgi:hypothetical protein